MKLIFNFLFLMFQLCAASMSAQSWEHYFPLSNYSKYASTIKQTYDGGYVIAENNQGGLHSKIFKLDVDGNVLWSKILYCSSGYEKLWDICETPEGGLMIVGGSECYDPGMASFIMRLDPCGEVKWIKEFGTFNDFDYGYRVIKLNDNNYLAGFRYLGPSSANQFNRINLIKFDLLGNIIWSGDYTHHNNADLNDIIESSDSSIYITGSAYSSYMGSPNYMRSHYIKIDYDGNEIWHQLYGLQDTVISKGMSSILFGDTSSMIISVFRDPVYNLKYWSYLIKVDSSGQVIWNKFLSATNELSEDAFRINKVNDSVAIVFNNVSYSYNLTTISQYNLKAIKINMNGNVLDSVQFGSNINFLFNSILNTDGDLVVCGEHTVGTQRSPFVIKINQNLEIDTLLNITFNYDSLCVVQIASDTIFYDTTVVAYNEINLIDNIKIYPTIIYNGEIHIVNNHIPGDANIIIYDISGRNVFSKSLYLNRGITDLRLPEYFVNGTFYLQLFHNEELFNEKILIWNEK